VPFDDFMLEIDEKNWDKECRSTLQTMRSFLFKIRLLREHLSEKSK
jgi:hypothetical protein